MNDSNNGVEEEISGLRLRFGVHRALSFDRRVGLKLSPATE